MNREVREILCRALQAHREKLENEIREIDEEFAKYHCNFRELEYTESSCQVFSNNEFYRAEYGKNIERELEIVKGLYRDFDE